MPGELLQAVEPQPLGFFHVEHHALVDGMAAVEMTQLLLDLHPRGRPAEPLAFEPAPAPGVLERAGADIASRLRLGACTTSWRTVCR